MTSIIPNSFLRHYMKHFDKRDGIVKVVNSMKVEMPLRVVLLAVVSVSSASAAFCSSAQLQAIRECYKPFFAGYNITLGDKDWPSYWPFHDYRMALLNNQGVDIQPYVCQLGSVLAQCTAPITCMDSLTYVGLGATLADSPDYWTDLLVTTYQCGAGYDILMHEYYCLAQCRSTNGAQLDKCNSDMQASILSGDDRCKAFNTFVTCQSVIYAGCCDRNAGVYACGVDQAGINAADPSCSASGQLFPCPKPSSFREKMIYKQKRTNRNQ